MTMLINDICGGRNNNVNSLEPKNALTVVWIMEKAYKYYKDYNKTCSFLGNALGKAVSFLLCEKC